MGAAPSVPDGGDPTAVTGSVSDVPKVSATHEFTIRDYSRTKGRGVGKSILSQYFTIDGRKWYIRFYPDGYSAADSAWVALYAQTLYKPQFRAVRAEFTFQLLGANGEVRHTRRSDRACKYDTFCNSWGIRRYIDRNLLESAALAAVHNDSITVRCTITIHKARRRSVPVPRPGLVMMPDQPASVHGQNAVKFLASGKAPFDVRFEVDGEIFEAHRMVVAAQSPWFEGLLYGHGRESRESDLADVGGGVVGAEAFRGVLHFIYNDELPAATLVTDSKRRRYEATLRLLEAADYYLLERLKMMCAISLGNDFITDSTLTTIAEYAEAYSCKELEQACRNFAERRGVSLLPNIEVMQRLMSRIFLASHATNRIRPGPTGVRPHRAPNFWGPKISKLASHI
ncbi:BTB/POZ and MATH domain-containing protein 2-like [Lolium perenne]|uniref:BTB/POZ and MATH domain-containing protein 2-like n=1 Tax=Lolium perenne TaxID=4522 RepID=UPI0021F59198|nr:BTB/POZ and MATH domain-containing protein 2-like [Lolium perenne]